MLVAAVLLLLGAPSISGIETLNGKTCYFPFTYDDVVYTECNAGGFRPWCYTSENYTTDLQWDYCVEEVENTTIAPPKECKFPFIYLGKRYDSCITKNNFGQHWCATTHNYDDDEESMLCDDQTKWQTTETPPRSDCSFPFLYKGKVYDECTTKGGFGMYWCATTDNFDEDRQWRLCDKSEEPKCTFPFIYNGTEYSECTDIDNYGVYWCATTANYDVDKRWRVCKVDNQPDDVYTTDGDLCALPFYYQGQMFEECTDYKSFFGKKWCSLTTEFKGEFGYCDLDD